MNVGSDKLGATEGDQLSPPRHSIRSFLKRLVDIKRDAMPDTSEYDLLYLYYFNGDVCDSFVKEYRYIHNHQLTKASNFLSMWNTYCSKVKV